VKVSAADSCGSLSVTEDNLTTEFVLPAHKHAENAETFYIVNGEVEFIVGGEIIIATEGDTVQVPPETPHTARCFKSTKILILFQPGRLEN
jgi:quercetin dioxygenase-like cupin family protein|tara:strand:- start:249 stop:521 length:273 start_codon:yes stop_codon:yes gene_type:complete